MSQGNRRLAALALTLVLPLAACSWGGGGGSEGRPEKQQRIAPLIEAVPGVTGGDFTVNVASINTNVYACELTSDRATQAELDATLKDVLKVLVDQTRDDKDTAMVSCVIRNGSLISTPNAVGLRQPTYLGDVRGVVG